MNEMYVCLNLFDDSHIDYDRNRARGHVKRLFLWESRRMGLFTPLYVYSTILFGLFLDLYKDTRLGVHFPLPSSDIFLLHNTTTRSFGSKAISIVYYYLRYINTRVSAFLNSLLKDRDLEYRGQALVVLTSNSTHPYEAVC